MAKKVIFEEEAREALLEGAQILNASVSSTMGPRSGNVVIDGPRPYSTHDGVTVARNIVLDGPEGVGAELIKQAANKMNDVAGDGTTTVTVLTYNLLLEAMELAEDRNRMVIRDELQQAEKKVQAELKKMRQKTTKKMLRHIANVSASSEELGKLAYEAGDAVGVDGTVLVEVGATNEDEIEIVDGVSLQWGMMSPFMATDQDKQEARLSNVPVLVVDDTIRSSTEVLPILQQLVEQQATELAIFCRDLSSEPLNVLVANIVRGSFRTVIVKTPMVEEVAEATGARMYGGSGPALSDFTGELGKANLIVATKENTTVVSEKGGEKTAVIRVGGSTEAEIEEKKFRIDDAVAAVKAAQEGGIVPGGGVALLVASKAIGNTPTELILSHALKVPFRTILSNAGLEADTLIAEAIDSGKGVDITGESQLVDMVEAGIVDPYKVTSSALETAVSLVCTAVTTAALVTEERDEDSDKKEP